MGQDNHAARRHNNNNNGAIEKFYAACAAIFRLLARLREKRFYMIFAFIATSYVAFNGFMQITGDTIRYDLKIVDKTSTGRVDSPYPPTDPRDPDNKAIENSIIFGVREIIKTYKNNDKKIDFEYHFDNFIEAMEPTNATSLLFWSTYAYFSSIKREEKERILMKVVFEPLSYCVSFIRSKARTDKFNPDDTRDLAVALGIEYFDSGYQQSRSIYINFAESEFRRCSGLKLGLRDHMRQTFVNKDGFENASLLKTYHEDIQKLDDNLQNAINRYYHRNSDELFSIVIEIKKSILRASLTNISTETDICGSDNSNNYCRRAKDGFKLSNESIKIALDSINKIESHRQAANSRNPFEIVLSFIMHVLVMFTIVVGASGSKSVALSGVPPDASPPSV